MKNSLGCFTQSCNFHCVTSTIPVPKLEVLCIERVERHTELETKEYDLEIN